MVASESTGISEPQGSLALSSSPGKSQLKVPSSSTFSFKAPFPASSSSNALKQRRVSLALPSSPRVVQAWSFRDDTGLDSHVPETVDSGLVPEKRGKMRKIAATADDDSRFQEKKQRKKWSPEETQMLVDGCNRHGVGNWKAILGDPTLTFDNRSPVDLKDRFRTYFPDAYKQHYPNARTHLSSKVRSTLPDGSSLFEKTRSKKRRPFTEEEDRALKAGYEKHGTVWATIVKDPVFQEQGRRSTDLRDRFRNAFPELYQAAGYKPRGAVKKKLASTDGPKPPIRAATDDQLAMSTTGPVRSRRRAHTSQGLLRGGTKSVPQSTACSEDEYSSGGEEDIGFKSPHTPVFVDNVSTVSMRTRKPGFSADPFADDDDEMEMVTLDSMSDPSLAIPDFTPSSHMDGQSQTWSSGVNTPTHSAHAWSTAAGSPTSSHLSSDYLMNSSHSPVLHRGIGNIGMIGKSAWGTHDWFSANPRLDSGSATTSSSFPDPGSPFSFHNLNHGVMDRYDLLPTSMPHDFSSEVGVGDTHSTFSDEMFPPSGFRGFTHHSNYAGDLIFGARTHQPQQSYYGSGFGFGAGSSHGLGLEGMTGASGLHPMLTPLPGIDEIELTGITLDDQADSNAMDDDDGIQLGVLPGQQKDGPQEQSMSDRFSLDDLVDLSHELHSTPPGTPVTRPRSTRRSSGPALNHYVGTHGRSISVPPSEVRCGVPSRNPPHSVSQPEMSPPRASPSSSFFLERSPQHHNDRNGKSLLGAQPVALPPPPSSFPSHMLMSSGSHDAWRSMPSGDISLSFLDLHYYSSMAASGAGLMDDDDGPMAEGSVQNLRQGQALDLARSVVSSSSAGTSFKSLGIPASLRQHIPQPQEMSVERSAAVGGRVRTKVGMGGARSQSSHQRGQSAVCPQDLLLRSDNKRKRASWDGGHS
ncbi:hypothetical protein BDZ94DRAFT_1312417 [Collybia nuda]|uniref:Meiotically up-regulated gene 152 protein n=1 Tax=Collybia nuda TaxID=64659 RepID=A0A9P6CBC6_9AGAR|nr:hypothetical protein BDZ94DRAFT_1312417 [Collybia nuda]